jgi:hypothetical protein
MNTQIEYIKGDLVENGRVTIEIDGKQIERVVRYNRTDGLYIVYKNNKYFEYEFSYSKYYELKDKGSEVDGK